MNIGHMMQTRFRKKLVERSQQISFAPGQRMARTEASSVYMERIYRTEALLSCRAKISALLRDITFLR